MNKTTRQIVLLLGIMSFLVLIFLSFSLTADSGPSEQRQNYEPDNISDQPEEPNEPGEGGEQEQNDQESSEEQTDPRGLLAQSARGLEMLLEDFIAGLSFVLGG